MHAFRLAVAAGLLLLCAAPVAADQCPISPRPNPVNECGSRAGSDLESQTDIAHENGCEFLCDGKPQCLAWTYVRADRTCFLKGEVAPLQNDDCCATGRKIN